MLRSLRPIWLNCWSTSSIFRTPSCSDSSVRKTETSVCITFCMAARTSLVLLGPVDVRTLSRTSIESAPASGAMSGCGWFGEKLSRIVWETARPKTIKSSNELAPSRLAPCTETQAASPQAKSPGTTSSCPLSLTRRTSPVYLVGIPV